MKERPIIFSTEMVKAILDDRKTQTRRIIKPQPHEEEYLEVGNYTPALIEKDGEMYPADYEIFGAYTSDGELTWRCPYGQAEDRLWIREALRWSGVGIPTRYSADNCPVFYNGETPNEWPFRTQVLPSIFMPRWASRVTLEITEVRVERLQEIHLGDIKSEGIDTSKPKLLSEHQAVFASLWDSLNAKRGYSWESNPWVWIISFRRINQ